MVSSGTLRTASSTVCGCAAGFGNLVPIKSVTGLSEPTKARSNRIRLLTRGQLQGGKVGTGLSGKKLVQDYGVRFAWGRCFGIWDVWSSDVLGQRDAGSGTEVRPG